jgi:predicted nuclease with TOPRIM domain
MTTKKKVPPRGILQKSEQTAHEILAEHITNFTEVSRRVAESAIDDHTALQERCRMLEEENAKLTESCARLTQKLLARAKRTKRMNAGSEPHTVVGRSSNGR